MSVMQGTANGLSIITQVYFQTQPYLGATMLGFLISSEMAGRLLGGLLQYKKEVPVNKRYPFTKAVYLIYSLADMALLFLPYPAMLANRFFCGSLGICSATIRESAVQSYLPEQMRQSQCLLQCTVRRGRGSLPVSGRRTWAAHTLSRRGGSAWRHGCRKRLPVHCSSCRKQPAGI